MLVCLIVIVDLILGRSGEEWRLSCSSCRTTSSLLATACRQGYQIGVYRRSVALRLRPWVLFTTRSPRRVVAFSLVSQGGCCPRLSLTSSPLHRGAAVRHPSTPPYLNWVAITLGSHSRGKRLLAMASPCMCSRVGLVNRTICKGDQNEIGAEASTYLPVR